MNYTLRNSTVTSQEAEALKEMIFNRARERAQALAEDTQASYTSAVQNDIMDMARESFSAAKNPFSEKKVEKPQNNIEEIDKNSEEIGFAKRNIEEIKSQIYVKNKSTNSTISNKEIEQAMVSARADFSNKHLFNGALEFLNSQASISLIKSRSKGFDVIA